MSKSQLEMVKEFHVATNSPVLPIPGVPPDDRVRLRAKLIMEEAMEVVGAMLGIEEAPLKQAITEINGYIDDIEPQSQLPNVMKELDDLEYVTQGARLEFGLGSESFKAVHDNNMTKVGGPMRADGKREKPPGYKKFDAVKWLAENGWPN